MTGAGVWVDVFSKLFSYCAVCDAADPLVLRVLGLCENLPYDHLYVQESHANTKPYFRGYSVSNISWHEGRWLAQHPDSEIQLSYTPAHPYEYPFGRRRWAVKEAEGCGRPEDGSLALALTTCSQGNFTCDDGSCLPMEMKCDSQADCPDESDENDCELMTIPESYRPNIPPRSSQSNAAYPVRLHVSVLALEIITDKMEIVMDFEVTLLWLDRRLVFNDLNEDSVINALRLDHLKKLWIPEVSFANAKGNAHTLIDGETDSSILRWGEPNSGDSTYSREVYFFAGAVNPIQLKRKYSATYSCSLNLALYPFDTQICSFNFVLTSARKEKLELVAAEQDLGVRYEGEWQLMEYTIERFSMLDKNHSKYSQKEVVIHFRRRYGFAILTVYIPSTFFVCIAYLTTFFPVSNLQVRVIIALTAMLVLTTLLNQVSAQLPRNSYFKAIDMWMFGAIGLIFSILIMQTVVDVVHRKAQETLTKVVPATEKIVGQFASENSNNEQRAARILKYMQIIFPLLVGVLVLIYSIYLFSSV
ncbi:glutamate-gated chloride channel subunit beta-like [Penaeus chinensis]|uniref:glutamate-gated chloride channel subunit beta-like n=1 Tax=Penaeus chinensis TaxID=139456 RepID=UPI001FB74A04|nr:glutamate-gated chloride channel subunit beta-like [Penaeus chinensis]